ncbi:DUF2332 domain-containing protein [Pseudonocardia aurantiaca]|uniref:DUF2332 domain-containing protein n=1 Tax=Pseudonocardia aurantiaca TaxID=75290 RepID=UPI0031DCFC10
MAAQAGAVATAWSPPDAPANWWLTAETFRAIAEDDVLLDLAAAVPAERLPPLVLSAAIRFLVTGQRPQPLVGYFPQPGGPQPPRDDGFRPALRAFCRSQADALARLCAAHRYQMNEVGRCLDVLPVLAQLTAADPRPLALVDLGTGAGLGLHLDRYRYSYDLADGASLVTGDPGSPVALSCAVRSGRPPVPERPITFSARVGVDTEPLDLTDPPTAAWLAACVPPEAGAVSRFAAAAAVARGDPAPVVRGDLLAVLPAVVAGLPADALVCLVDTYVHVFLPADRRARFDALVDRIGRDRDLDWISVDPLVPLGPDARATVQGLDVPAEWIRDNREQGVFGVIGRVSVRRGVRTGAVLGRAHPGSAWLEWTAQD